MPKVVIKSRRYKTKQKNRKRISFFQILRQQKDSVVWRIEACQKSKSSKKQFRPSKDD
jgi:hypothetical protein